MKFNLNKNIGLLKSLGWVIAGVLVFMSIGFAKKEQRVKICQGVIIHISNQHDNYFIDEEDIMSKSHKHPAGILAALLIVTVGGMQARA